MRRKYASCQREDGDCAICSLVNYWHDCHNRPISKLALARRSAGMTQAQLAAAAGVNIRLVQKVELGEALASNLTAANLLALADALGVDPHDLL